MARLSALKAVLSILVLALSASCATPRPVEEPVRLKIGTDPQSIVAMDTDAGLPRPEESCDTVESCSVLLDKIHAQQGACVAEHPGGFCWRFHNEAERVYATKVKLKAIRDRDAQAVAREHLDAAIHRAEQRERDEAERQAAQLAEIKSREDAQEAWKKSEHDKLVEYFRLLGIAGRSTKLKDCYAGRGLQNDCTVIIALALEGAETEDEKKRLVALNESLIRQSQHPSNSAPAHPSQGASSDDSPLVCNDGELSPSCTCHGNHRGCCSHHGGISGCAR